MENNNDVSLDDNGIDLYGFVKDYEFSTALGEESQKINRKYFLIFSFNNNISGKNKLALSFINTITEKQINSGKLLILGDWFTFDSYGIFDGENLILKRWDPKNPTSLL